MKVYLVYANQDMTEGRGPMTLVRVMKYEDDAIYHAMKQPGVMGRNNGQTKLLSPKNYKLSWPGQQFGLKLVEGDWEVIEVELE